VNSNGASDVGGSVLTSADKDDGPGYIKVGDTGAKDTGPGYIKTGESDVSKDPGPGYIKTGDTTKEAGPGYIKTADSAKEEGPGYIKTAASASDSGSGALAARDGNVLGAYLSTAEWQAPRLEQSSQQGDTGVQPAQSGSAASMASLDQFTQAMAGFGAQGAFDGLNPYRDDDPAKGDLLTLSHRNNTPYALTP